MSSLSIATVTRSARCVCSASAKAARSASAAAGRSATSPPFTTPSGSALSPLPTMRRRVPPRRPTMTRIAPALTSTPATAGPRGADGRASRGWGAGLVAVTSPVQTLADRRSCRFDRLRKSCWLLPARRRIVGPSAALAVDERRHLFHELVGVDLVHQILRDEDDERGIPSEGG